MTSQPLPGPKTFLSDRTRVVVLVAVALLVSTLLELHVQWMNGMLWTREWCDRLTIDAIPVFLAASLPLWYAVWRAHRRGRFDGALTLGALTTACLLLMVAGSMLDEGGILPDRLSRTIQHEYQTSYYTDALRLSAHPGFLAEYPHLMDSLHLHSENKPPGPILFFIAFVKLLGPGEASAYASGLCLALLAALVVPATFFMVRTLTHSREAAFCAAALTALCPALALGMPLMDQLTPLFTCLMVSSWALALREDSRAAAVGFGATFAIALFFSPLVLVIGLFLAALTVHHIAPRTERRARLLAATRQVAIVAVTLVGLYAAAYAFTGYDAPAVFREILGSKYDWDANLTRQEILGRPYWKALISDPWEFLLGTGWLIALLALYRQVDIVRTRSGAWIIEVLAVAQIVIMPQLGFVRGESARLWLFLVPFLVLPAGMELARWTPMRRVIAFACLFVVLVTIYLNMMFKGN